MNPGKRLAPVLVVLFALAACAPGTSSGSPAQPAIAQRAAATSQSGPSTAAPVPVRVATSATGQNGYLVKLITERGIDVKYGIKLEPLFMDFTEAANALKLGRADVSIMQPSTAVTLKREQLDLLLFAPQVYSGNSFVVRADAPYRSLQDLKGKKIGNFSRVTGAFFFSAVLAKQNGLDIEKDFQAVVAETGALLALLERGEVEAINIFEPITSRLVASGSYRVLVDFDEEMESLFGTAPIKSALAATTEWSGKNPELVMKLRSAFAEGIGVIKARQDEATFRSEGKEFFGLKSDAELEAAWNRNAVNYADKWGPAVFEAQNRILQTGIDLGLVPNVPGWQEMWLD